MTDETQPEWAANTGLPNETTRVPIYPGKKQKADWEKSAERMGFASLSRYIIRRVEDARKFERLSVGSPGRVHKKLETLEQENQDLRHQLEQLRRKSGGRPAVDDAEFLERFLTDHYQSLDELLQAIVESGVLNDLIRKRVEDKPYYLASQDRVRYERGWGWKLVEEDE